MYLFRIAVISLSVIIEISLAFFIFRHYFRTRFIPSFLLGSFFFTSGIIHIVYLPIFFLDSTQIELATIILELIFIIIIISLPILIMFFEALNSKINSIPSIIILIFAFFQIGYYLSPIEQNSFLNIEYNEKNGWIHILTDEMMVILALYLLFASFIIILRLFQFLIIQKKEKKELKSFKIVIISYLFAFIGEMLIGSYNIIFLTNISILLGYTIIAFIYLRNPHSLFLSNAKIYQIIYYNRNSGIPIFTWGSKISSLASGFYGSTLLQQEIAGTKTLPKKLIFGDRTFLIDSIEIENKLISGILIVNKNTTGFYHSLKYSLKRFKKQFRNEILEKIDKISVFAGFEKEIVKIFDYALEKR